jgi:hypothetical protein
VSDFSSTIHIGAGPMWLAAPALSTLEVGRWYVGWRCAACNWPAALFDDPSAGAIRMRVVGTGCIVFRCPLCSVIVVGIANRPIQFRHGGWMQRLVAADRHVREGEARIARTLKAINSLSLRGRNTARADALLDTLLRVQHNLRWRRSLLMHGLLEGAAAQPAPPLRAPASTAPTAVAA